MDRVDLHWSREEFGSQKELYQILSRERLKQNIVDFQKAIENNEKFAELLEKGPSNLSAEEKKRTRNYAQGDVVRFKKDYKSLGFQKGECAEIARVDYEYNTVYLRAGSGREVEWQPWRHSKVDLFREHEFVEKQQSQAVEDKWRPARNTPEKEIGSSDHF